MIPAAGLQANDLRLRLALGRHSGQVLRERMLRGMQEHLWQSSPPLRIA